MVCPLLASLARRCTRSQVDLRGAIQAGIPFCRAANNVVLSEGPIPLQFVRRIRVRSRVPWMGPRRAVVAACCTGRPPASTSALCALRAVQLRDLPEEWQRAIPNRDSLMEKEEEEAQTGGFGRRQ